MAHDCDECGAPDCDCGAEEAEEAGVDDGECLGCSEVQPPAPAVEVHSVEDDADDMTAALSRLRDLSESGATMQVFRWIAHDCDECGAADCDCGAAEAEEAGVDDGECLGCSECCGDDLDDDEDLDERCWLRR